MLSTRPSRTWRIWYREWLSSQIRARVANAFAEGEFFRAHPALNKQAHGRDVERLARLYRSANPNATLQEVIRDVGAMAIQTLKLTPQPSAKPNGARPHASPSFVPAVGGGAKGPPQQPEVNPWAGLGMDFD